MKRIIAILTIFYCGVMSAQAPYQCMLKELWDKVSIEKEIATEQGFLSQDIKTFFEDAPERALIFFFPKGCGFDRLVCDEEQFIDLEEFFELAESYGYSVPYCNSQRHLVSFESREEMAEFVCDVFGSELIEEEVPLFFPSRLIIAELSKN